MQSRRGAREARRVRIVSPKLRRQRGTTQARMPGPLHTHSFINLLDDNITTNEDDELLLLPSTPYLLGSDPSLTIVSVEAALNKAALGSDALCSDLCTIHSLAQDIPALAASKAHRGRSRFLSATRRPACEDTGEAAADALLANNAAAEHNNNTSEAVITVPLSPVPQKAAGAAQIVSSILDQHIDPARGEGKDEEEDKLKDDEAAIETGLDALRERLAQARKRLESHIGRRQKYDLRLQSSEDKRLTRSGSSRGRRSKHALLYNSSSFSSSDDISRGNAAHGGVWSELLSSSPPSTSTENSISSSSSSGTIVAGHYVNGEEEDNEEWLAGLDEAVWLPAMSTQQHKKHRKNSRRKAMHFHPTEYAMRLLREEPAACSATSDTKYNTNIVRGAAEKKEGDADAEEGEEEEARKDRQASSAKLMHELSRQYAEELHRQLTHDPALRRYLANKQQQQQQQSAAGTPYTVGASDELQQLLMCSLSNRAAPVRTMNAASDGVQNEQVAGKAAAESNDKTTAATATAKAASALRKANEEKDAAVLRAQEMLVSKLLQSLPPVPQDLQDELGRQRRLLEHLVQLQQREQQRRQREAEEEVRRRVQAPRLDPATALFSEALHGKNAETNARLGLTKVLEPFTMAQQLQRLAADTQRPLPPLLTLTTGAASPASLPPPPLHSSAAQDYMKATHTSQLSQQLQAMQERYEGVLAAEQAKRHAERQAFTELLQRQQAQLLQQHRRALDTLRHELQHAKKAQEEQMQRLAASKDAALEQRSAAVQAAHTTTMKHMLQGAVEVMKSYATPPTSAAAARAYAPRKSGESRTTKDKTSTQPEDVHKQDNKEQQQTAAPPPPLQPSEAVRKTKPRIDAHFRGPVTVQLPDICDVSQSLSATHGVREAQLRRLYGSRRSPGQSLRTRKPKPLSQQPPPKKTHGAGSSVQQRTLSAKEVSSNAQSRSRFIAQETRSLSDDTVTNDDENSSSSSGEVSTTIQDFTGTAQQSVTQRPNASRRASSSHAPHTEANAADGRALLHQSLTAGRPAVGRTMLLLTTTNNASQSRTQASTTAAEANTAISSLDEANTPSEGVYFGADETGCTYGRLWGEYSAALREVQTLQHALQAEQAASLVHTREESNETTRNGLPDAARGDEHDEQQQSVSSLLVHTHGSSVHQARNEQGPHIYRSTAAMQRHMSRLQHSKEEALLRQLRLPGDTTQAEPQPAADEHHIDEGNEEEEDNDHISSEPLLQSGPELLTVSSTVAARARELRVARQRLRRIAAVLFREDEHDRVPGNVLLPSTLQHKDNNNDEAVAQLQRGVREGLAQETIHSVIGAAAEQALMSQLRRVLSAELLQRVLTSHIVQQQQQQEQESASQNNMSSDARRLHEEQGWAEAIEAATTTMGNASDAEIGAVLESGLQELIAHRLQEKQQRQQHAHEKDVQPTQAVHITTSKEEAAATAQRTSIPSVPSTAVSTALTIPTIHVSGTTAEASLTEHEVVHVPADPHASWLHDRPGKEEQQLVASSEQRHSLTSYRTQLEDRKREQSVVIEPVVHNNNTYNNTTSAAGGALRTQTRDGAVHILIDVSTLARNNNNISGGGGAWQPLMPSAAHALPPMQREQPRRLVREETLHDVIVESVEPRLTRTTADGGDVQRSTGLAALPVPSLLPPSASSGVRAEMHNAAVDEAARQAQRVQAMWQRLGSALEQDEAQQRWLLCEEEMLQRHTLSQLRERWAATLAVHTQSNEVSKQAAPQQQLEGEEHSAGQTNAQEEATPTALPPVTQAAERYIRDPVTRFVFEWLHEFAPREAAQRMRSAAEQNRYLVEQLHQGDAFAVPDNAEHVQAETQESNNKAAAAAAAARLQTTPSSPSPSHPHTSSTSSSFTSSATYSATHASSLTSGGGHVFAQTSEPLSRRMPRYTAHVLASASTSSSSPSPPVQPDHMIQYGSERSRRHRPVLHAEAVYHEEQGSTTTTTTTTTTTSSNSNAYPVMSVPPRADNTNNHEGRYAARGGEGSRSSVTTRYTTLTTNTTSEEDEEKEGVLYTEQLQPPSLLAAPSSVTTRTANSASLTATTTTITSSSSRPRYDGQEREGQALPHNSSSSTTTTNNTHTTRATTTTTTTSATTETSEASVQEVERSSAAAAAAARHRRLISPLNAEDIEAETDTESEGERDAAGQPQGREESAPRPQWW